MANNDRSRSLIERAIRFVLENFPATMFICALAIATLLPGRPPTAERYLSWLLLMTVGLQGLWGGITHVVFPQTGARYIGWQTSPFQTEIGFADLAMGVTAIVSFWQGLPFKAAIVIYASVFYLGVAWVHLRDLQRTGNRAKGNFGGLLAMTVSKAVLLPALLWLAYRAH